MDGSRRCYRSGGAFSRLKVESHALFGKLFAFSFHSLLHCFLFGSPSLGCVLLSAVVVRDFLLQRDPPRGRVGGDGQVVIRGFLNGRDRQIRRLLRVTVCPPGVVNVVPMLVNRPLAL